MGLRFGIGNALALVAARLVGVHGGLHSTLLKGLDAGEGRLAALAGSLPDAEDTSKHAEVIIQGLTEAFLATSVSDNERACLSDKAANIAEDVTATSLSTVQKLQSIFGDMKGVANDFAALNKQNAATPPSYGYAYGPALGASSGSAGPLPLGGNAGVVGFQPGLAPPGGYPRWARPPSSSLLRSSADAVTTVEMARLTALELSNSLKSMFNVEQKLATECLKGDSLAAVQLAKAHMKNMTYVGGHLVANGVDVVAFLAAALTSYEDKDYEKFGTSVGSAWRKVLLAKGEAPSNLIERLEELVQNLSPTEVMKELDPKIMAEISQGIVTSLFGSDFKVKLLAEGAGEIPSTYTGGWLPPRDEYWDIAPKGTMQFKMPAKYMAATKDTTININMQECVAGNLELFSAAYRPVVGLSEQFMEGHCTGSVRSLCMSLWTVVLSDVEHALTNCGFSSQQETVLIHSMWAGKALHANLSVPDEDIKAKNVTLTMASALEDWSNKDYEKFGESLGTMMKDLIVVTFPQEYSFDEGGCLRRILEDSSRSGLSTWLAVSAAGLMTFVVGLVVKRVNHGARGYSRTADLGSTTEAAGEMFLATEEGLYADKSSVE